MTTFAEYRALKAPEQKARLAELQAQASGSAAPVV